MLAARGGLPILTSQQPATNFLVDGSSVAKAGSLQNHKSHLPGKGQDGMPPNQSQWRRAAASETSHLHLRNGGSRAILWLRMPGSRRELPANGASRPNRLSHLLAAQLLLLVRRPPVIHQLREAPVGCGVSAALRGQRCAQRRLPGESNRRLRPGHLRRNQPHQAGNNHQRLKWPQPAQPARRQSGVDQICARSRRSVRNQRLMLPLRQITSRARLIKQL